jgi:hypothetical protein
VIPTVETGDIPIGFGTLLPNKLVTGCWIPEPIIGLCAIGIVEAIAFPKFWGGFIVVTSVVSTVTVPVAIGVFIKDPPVWIIDVPPMAPRDPIWEPDITVLPRELWSRTPWFQTPLITFPVGNLKVPGPSGLPSLNTPWKDLPSFQSNFP